MELPIRYVRISEEFTSPAEIQLFLNTLIGDGLKIIYYSEKYEFKNFKIIVLCEKYNILM